MNVPDFEPDELRAELERLLNDKKNQSRPLVALFGRSACTSVDTKAAGPVLVRSVGSEFSLRRALPSLQGDVPRMAVLVGWAQSEVPVDLSWRFVGNGKVFRVGKADRLRQLFGGPNSLAVADSSLSTSKLGNLLLAQPVSMKTTAGRVTKDVAYETWLRAMWGLGVDNSLGLDTLLAWAATHGLHADFVTLMGSPHADGVRAELDEFLERRLGDAAPMVWKLWTEGKGRTLLEFAILFETLVEDEAAGPLSAIRTASKHALGLAGTDFEKTWRPVGRAVDTALRELDHVDPAFGRQLLKDAQAHLDTSEQSQLAASRRLPIAWNLRLDALGRTLADGANNPTVAAVEQARQDLLALDRHGYSRQDDQRRTIDRAEMATRLLAWLVARPDQRVPKGRNQSADAEALAIWYAQEGGYIDWARHRCRGSGDSAFGKGVDKVLAKVDGIRVEQDRRFANGLVARLQAKDKSEPLVAIHDAVKLFAARFLDANAERRVLVLLIDGMAWAQAVSILHSLDTGANPWGPAAWNVEAFPKSTHIFTPVLASLPSVTNISRSAFFAGKRMESGKKHSAGDNQKHWETNSAITKFFPGMTSAKLMLRGEGFKTDGSAATEAMTLVSDTSQRIVGLVINAIDETLKADTQAQGTWTADEIGALRELLQAASAAGRAVLIASDHGHVSGQRLEWTGFNSTAKTSRWRHWLENDPVHEYEVAVSHDCTWGPKGDGIKGIICLADDMHSYAPRSHYGEHGGATLSEVLAPTFMLSCENLVDPAMPDRSLELRRVRAPDWWHLDVRVGEPRRKTGSHKASAETKRTNLLEKAGQLPILGAQVSAPVATAETSTPDEEHVSAATRQLLDKLEKNPLFAARTEHPKRRKETLLAVQFLLERSNNAPSGMFASFLGQPAYRVGGLVANLSEVLNVDGYEVLTLDTIAKQVLLNAEQLKIGFGL